MSGRTHSIIGVVIGYVTGSLFVLDTVDLIIAVVLSAIYSLLPDIDHPHSKLGKYIPILPHLIEHRTYTHTVWFCLITSLPFVFISIPLFVCCLAAGLSHLALDSLTLSGIRPLIPLHGFRMRWILRTGGVADNLIFVFVVVFTVYYIFNY